MFDTERGENRLSLFNGTLKTVAVIGFLGVCATTWLSKSALEQPGVSRLARVATPGLKDPETTGSISAAANATRFDPCTLFR